MSLSLQLSVYYHEVNSEIQGCTQKMRFVPTGQNFYCLFSFIPCFCKLEIVLSSELQLVFTVSSLVGSPVSFLRMPYTHLPYLILLIWSVLKVMHCENKILLNKFEKRKTFGLFSGKII